ncbi:MAG: hypothetical protein A3G25_08780 [Betaproteobacteria bacterium RIFCSPLOWO2_12_FULL_63_13]|nr:MAG: hypothetical protein A3H32_04340 [Betaproteobacteria bacterium RIFCSPLOWO2_02_FULL_63_19]OGA47156.1 MAG: hypothetical protein A3G25_08780 [Betaproteobacteria bacterium RIFCSPLOWO2_12_FULL_63_13]
MNGSAARELTRGKPYAETFRCPGGALCLDFCNSGQGVRGSRAVEWIAGYPELVDWLEAADAIPRAQAARLLRSGATAPTAAAAAWKQAIIVREALFRVFSAAARQTAASRPDLELVEAEFATCVTSSRLDWLDGRYVWRLQPEATSPRVVVHPIVRSAVDLLTSETLSRLRQCAGETCSWLFLDETKNRSRRWCEMASCGNLAKVRRHRERVV